ncbi:MAG TPA: DNA cytosine methyltransferase [Methanomassiliicoccales archaeon]|nr:DNA cytosine methyltransferase [Methanomassiliicoccales archaeon]
MDQPSRTILTSEGNRRPNRIGHIIPVDQANNMYRVLTPIELERLNCFEDDWTIGMPERWRYFCMGNALVVGLIEQMGNRLSEVYSMAEEQGSGSIEIRRAAGRIIGPLDMCVQA